MKQGVVHENPPSPYRDASPRENLSPVNVPLVELAFAMVERLHAVVGFAVLETFLMGNIWSHSRGSV